MSKLVFKLFAAVMAIIFTAAATAENTQASVIISQVLYNPANSESGGEAVELYNPATMALDISNWVIATETSPTDATIQQGTFICSRCYYLIADANWSNAKDNAEWPNADLEESITLANTDAGVALKESNGTIIDAVGWGNSANIGNGLFEGTPHEGAAEGLSLQRKFLSSNYLDTDNNSNDFLAAAPNFHNSTSSASALSKSELTVIAIITANAPKIESFRILTDDDALTNGSQVSPVPKSNKTVVFEAVVSKSNESLTATVSAAGSKGALAKVVDVNATAAIYRGSINLSFSAAPGTYMANATVTNSFNLSASASASFEYLSLLAFELDSSLLVFKAPAGGFAELIGDFDSSTSNVTITNIGNVVTDFELSATNLSNANSVIDSQMLYYSFDSNFNSDLAGNFSIKKRKNVKMLPESSRGLSFKLNVPSSTAPGNYSGKVSVVAVSG